MINKEYFEKGLKKRNTVILYTGNGIPLKLTKHPCVRFDNRNLADFGIEGADLADYCNAMGLTLTPTNINKEDI